MDTSWKPAFRFGFCWSEYNTTNKLSSRRKRQQLQAEFSCDEREKSANRKHWAVTNCPVRLEKLYRMKTETEKHIGVQTTLNVSIVVL